MVHDAVQATRRMASPRRTACVRLSTPQHETLDEVLHRKVEGLRTKTYHALPRSIAHAPVVRKSTIPGAGLGLFIRQPVTVGAPVAILSYGTTSDTQPEGSCVQLRGGAYQQWRSNLADGSVSRYAGGYANGGDDHFAENSVIVHLVTADHQDVTMVLAAEDMEADAEVLVDYGNLFGDVSIAHTPTSVSDTGDRQARTALATLPNKNRARRRHRDGIAAQVSAAADPLRHDGTSTASSQAAAPAQPAQTHPQRSHPEAAGQPDSHTKRLGPVQSKRSAKGQLLPVQTRAGRRTKPTSKNLA